MVRQDVEAMIAVGFTLIDKYKAGENPVVVVPTTFGKVGELDGAQEDWVQDGNISIPNAKNAG